MLENNDVLSIASRRSAALKALHEYFDAWDTTAFIVNAVDASEHNKAIENDFIGHWICISLHPIEHRVEIRDNIKCDADYTDVARPLGDLFF